MIEFNDAGDAIAPHLGMNSAGTAFAIWYLLDGSSLGAYTTRFYGGQWDAPVLLGSGLPRWSDPQVAVDPYGNAIAVFTQTERISPTTSETRLYASRFVPGTGWSAETLLQTGRGNATYPQIATDSTGNAVVVWAQYDGTTSNVYASRFDVATGWGTATLIEDKPGYADEAHVAVDSSGNAIAVWEQAEGNFNIYANRFVPGMGWGNQVLIENFDGGNARDPDVAIDSAGSAMAVWRQGKTIDRIFANQFVPGTAGTGWGSPMPVGPKSGHTGFAARVVAQGTGTFLTVFMQSNGNGYDIMANRFTTASGWGTPTLIETGSGNAQYPQVAADGLGNAFAVWEQSDGTRFSIFANRFTV